MTDWLHHIDFSLFEFINQDLANTFFDWFLPPFRNRDTWFPLYIIVLFYLLLKYKWRAFIIVVLAILSIGIADGVSSHMLKPWVARLRPCKVAELASELYLRVNHCSGGFSFPSSHAANHFALASFLGLVLYKKNKWFWRIGILWATIISFAQVYVGVHFPADVLFGATLGLFIGWFVYRFPFRFLNRLG